MQFEIFELRSGGIKNYFRNSNDESKDERLVMRQRKKVSGFILIAFFAFLISGISLADTESIEGAERLTITVNAGAYQIISGEKGQRIQMEGFGYLMVPGKPMLPAKNFLIALPPGARVHSIEVTGTGATQLPGTYQIMPAPPIVPLVDPLQHPELVRKMAQERQSNYQAVYSTDQAFPNERGRLTSSGTLRKHSYASVSFCPN